MPNPHTEFDRCEAAAESIRRRCDVAPALALVLGSGLGAFADRIDNPTRIPFGEIPGFAPSTVPGHDGALILGHLGALPVAIMRGRIHAYEGHGPADVVRPLRTLARLGARTVLLTNAAGSLNPDFRPGDLMCITDHLNLTGLNPLNGPNDDRLGPRFPDMSRVWDPAIGEAIERHAHAVGVPMRRGVYAGLAGPCYETPAEIRMLQRLGGDAVGMSTVLEAIAARHMGLRVAGISCITNLGAGLGDQPLTHDEVQQTADRVRDAFVALLDRLLRDPLVASPPGGAPC